MQGVSVFSGQRPFLPVSDACVPASQSALSHTNFDWNPLAPEAAAANRPFSRRTHPDALAATAMSIAMTHDSGSGHFARIVLCRCDCGGGGGRLCFCSNTSQKQNHNNQCNLHVRTLFYSTVKNTTYYDSLLLYRLLLFIVSSFLSLPNSFSF